MTDAGETVDEIPMPQVALSSPAAGLLADLLSIAQDIDFARQCADSCAEPVTAQELNPEQALTQKAKWNAAVIAYRRAFNSGKGHIVDKASRPRLDKYFLQYLDSDGRMAHEQVWEMADKHVAHRAGPLEQIILVAMLQPAPLERGVAGIGTLTAHFVAPEPALATNLSSLCSIFLDLLHAEIEAGFQNLLDGLRDHADLDQLHAHATIPAED